MPHARTSRHARTLAVVTAVALLAPACSTVPKLSPALVLARPTPTPEPTPTPDPTPEMPAAAAPFTLALEDVILASTSNAAMFAAPEPAADEPVVRDAIESARLRAEAYLNAMFVDPQTRFSTAAVQTLVDPALLDAGALAALGVLDPGIEVTGTRTGTASALADVHIDITTVGAVTLAYTATTDLMLTDAAGPVTQEGYISVVNRGAGPEVVLLTATTTFGGTLSEVLG